MERGTGFYAQGLVQSCLQLTAMADLNPSGKVRLQSRQLSKDNFCDYEAKKFTRGSTGQSAPVGRSGASLLEDLKSSFARCRLD